MGNGEIRLVERGYTASKFVINVGTGVYEGKLGVDAKIISKPIPKEMWLLSTNGTTAIFHDFDSSHGDKIGGLKKIVDAHANTLTVDYFTAAEDANLVDLIQTITDTGGRTWNYTYINIVGHVNNRKLSAVEVKTGATTIARVDFLHFGATGFTFAPSSGTNGDLMRIIVTIKDSNGQDVTRTSMFRYYTGTWSTSNLGTNHKLKFIVGPQSYSELAAAVADPLQATDTQVETYADYKLEYDSNSFVTKAVIQGGGCSCTGGAKGTYTYAYTPNNNWSPSSADSVWRMSVTLTNPDKTVRIVDVNGAGTILNDVFQPENYQTGDQRWITHYKLDGNWRVKEKFNPSACNTYSVTGHSVTPFSGAGLVEITKYDANGNLSDIKVKEGNLGSEYFIEKRAFTSKTLGAHTIYLPSSVKVYPVQTTDENATTAIATTIAYNSFYPDTYDFDGDSNTTEDSLAVKELTITLPVVPSAENGENANHTHKYFRNAQGQLQWEKDELGSIDYREYHSALGLLTKIVVDMDTDGANPAPPSGFSNSTGLSLTTLLEFDNQARLTKMTDPGGQIEIHHYTHLSTGEPVVLIAPHASGTTFIGPETIQIFDFDGHLITTARGDPTYKNTNLDEDFNEAQATLEAAFVGDLYERTEFEYTNGQKSKMIRWKDAEIFSAGTHDTLFGYDNMGRLARIKDPLGTITRIYYTIRGLVTATDIGTNDTGDTLGEPSGTNNMTTIEERFYDYDDGTGSTVGDGNLTGVLKYISDTTVRIVEHYYDWRNRKTDTDGAEKFYENVDYDNLDRPTVRYRYDTTLSSSNLRSKSETKYNSRGRVFETIIYEVSQTDGTIDDSMTTRFWYDARSDLIKRRDPSGLFTKNVIDGARRVTKTFVSYDTDETGYSEADDVTGDIVVSQVAYKLDAVGKTTLLTRFERDSTSSTTGELTTSIARRFYVASWYDLMHRLVASVDYGDNGGSTLTPPTDPPTGSDNELRTDWGFDVVGRLKDVTDPMGRTERRGYDNLGRVTSIISNYLNGTQGENASEDDDRKQTLEYDGNDNIVKRKVWMTGTTDHEETEFVFGVTKGASAGDSKLASNSLLKTIKYPDPSSGDPSTSSSDQEAFAYNAQEDIVYRKDQNGTVRLFSYDALGRMTADEVDTFGSGVNQSTKKITREYDSLDRVTSTKSYHIVNSVLTLKNEVALIYNGFGQVTESKQEHNGAVGANTLKVAYSFSEAENGDPISRLKSIVYPVTASPALVRTVYFHYDDPSGSGDYAKLDWILGRVSGISNNSSISGDRIADYTFEGLSRVDKRVGQEPSGSGTADVVVDYDYDRFGRREYITADGTGDINTFRYGFNRNSAAIWREENNASTSGKDELYKYDLLDRIDVFKRGDLNAARDDITTPVRSQDWGLDLVGNWKSIDTSGTTINRAHNRSNEITDVDTNPNVTDGDPTYDNNGNTTSIHRPAASKLDYEFDAWNRIVKCIQSTVTLANFSYDGFGRKISDSFLGHHYYYSEAWQLLSERNGSTSSDKTLREYVWGIRYIDEILARYEDKNGDGDTSDAGDGKLYYVQDANWNVTALCDGAGAVAERYLYDPFGLPTIFSPTWGSQSATLYGNKVLFSGRWWRGSNTNTYDFRNREYSPYLGRLLQRDPTGIWGDEVNFGNGYAYVGNDPINRVDPFGEDSLLTKQVTERHGKMCVIFVYKWKWFCSPFTGQPFGAWDQIGAFWYPCDNEDKKAEAELMANQRGRLGQIHSGAEGAEKAAETGVEVVTTAVVSKGVGVLGGMIIGRLTVPEWVRSGGAFVNWLKNLQKQGVKLTKEEADDIVRLARKEGVDVRVDPPHPNTPWDKPHLNIGKEGQVHLEVPDGYQAPP